MLKLILLLPLKIVLLNLKRNSNVNPHFRYLVSIPSHLVLTRTNDFSKPFSGMYQKHLNRFNITRTGPLLSSKFITLSAC